MFSNISKNDINRQIHFDNVAACEMNASPGQEHYKLLAYASTLFHNKTLIDIGTHMGKSALALSYNVSNTVISFDIHNQLDPTYFRSNIQYQIADLWNPSVQQKWTQTILEAPLIFLDVDPHNGVAEWAFYEFLLRIRYQGVLLCDDIWYFKEMRDRFWYKIPLHNKRDLSHLGHWSGTGLITMTPPSLRTTPHANWTLVTAYFDLTKCPDASDEIRARDRSHYIDTYGQATLHLPYNLVVFCDKASYQQIRAIRPESAPTHFVVCEFDDFRLELNGPNFSQLREQIAENRRKNPYHFDPRNTPSYLLFCMSRYVMLQHTIATNPFGGDSTHFAWINICIERMGHRNLMYLDEALAANRDRFSTCHIDYIDKALANNYPEFFKNGGLCSLCSGFFTGNAAYMSEFCRLILAKARDVIAAGYGHADEQFMCQVYHDRPDLFDNYYGDYQQMITNYRHTREPTTPTQILIPRAFQKGDHAVCLRACEAVIDSCVQGYCDLTDEQKCQLGYYLIYSKRAVATQKLN